MHGWKFSGIFSNAQLTFRRKSASKSLILKLLQFCRQTGSFKIWSSGFWLFWTFTHVSKITVFYLNIRILEIITILALILEQAHLKTWLFMQNIFMSQSFQNYSWIQDFRADFPWKAAQISELDLYSSMIYLRKNALILLSWDCVVPISTWARGVSECSNWYRTESTVLYGRHLSMNTYDLFLF